MGQGNSAKSLQPDKLCNINITRPKKNQNPSHLNAVNSPKEAINEDPTYLDHADLLRFVSNCSFYHFRTALGLCCVEFYLLQKLKELKKHPLIQHRVLRMDHMTMIIQNLSLNLTVKDARHSLINMLKFQRMHIKFLMVLRRL